jgi:RNA polymerase sigma-70 factor, ECF subfamily
MTLAYLYCAAEGFDPDSANGIGKDSPGDAGANYESRHLQATKADRLQLQVLVAAIQQGDETSFERLFRLYYERIVRYVVALVRDRETAEDVVQTVFARLWEHRNRWTVQTTVEAYLIRMARNQAIDVMRRDRREHRWENSESETAPGAAPALSFAPDIDAERRDLLQHVSRAVAQLPVRHREILALKWGGRHTHTEIAEITGQPVRTVETQVARAVKALRLLLAGTID